MRFLSSGANNNNQNFGKPSKRFTPKSIVGKLIVPPEMTSMYVTGVAAGGRGVGADSYAVYQNYTGNAVAAVSASGDNAIMTSPSATSSPITFIDPVGLKTAMASGISDIPASCAGYGAFVNDAGFCYSYGSGGTVESWNGGRSWLGQQAAIGGNGTNQRAADIAPATTLEKTRLSFIASPTELGSARKQGQITASYSGKTFNNIFNCNGYFFVGESNATTKTSLYYQTDDKSINPAGWPSVVIDGVNQKILADVCYGNGLYVASFTDGSIYTATTPGGTWTLRTSNVTNLQNLRFANGRFLGCGTTQSTTSLDGIIWTEATLGAAAGTLGMYRYDFAYASSMGAWCIRGSTGILYSTDGGAWAARPHNAVTPTSIADHPAGLILGSTSGVSVVYDLTKNYAEHTLSSSRDGGDLRVIRASDREELLNCKGGLSNGAAGSSNLVTSNTSTGLSLGMNGNNPPLLWNLPDAAHGIKIPGGNGNITGSGSTGGGSIMAAPVAATNSDVIGYGAGSAANTTNCGGGGGEGVARYRVPVTPGETILYSAGLPHRLSVSGVAASLTVPYVAGQGHISFEFE